MTTEEQQLADMLHRVAPEPPRPVTVEDVAFRLAHGHATDRAGSGRRRHRELRESRERPGSWGRRWAPVLAAASVIVVAGASAGIASVVTSHRSPASYASRASSSPSASPSVSSPAPSVPPTPAHPTSPPELVANGMWGAELINRDTFDQASLTSSPDGLYATSEGYLDRINPATGDVVASVPYSVSSLNSFVVIGNTVWAVGSSTSTSVVLHGYDGKTLAQVGSVAVPVSGFSSGAGTLTSGSGGHLYLAAGSSVMVVNPATRQVVRQLTVSGPVNSVAVSPDGSRLYVSPAASEGTVKLLIYNFATGALIGSSTTDTGSNGANLVATSGGVWGTMGEGMSEWVWFAPDGNLAREVRVSQGAGAGLASLPVVSGSAVWIGGSHTLECADPATGRVLASAAIPTDHSVVEYFGSVTITGGHAYAYYIDQQSQRQGVVTLTPPAACFG